MRVFFNFPEAQNSNRSDLYQILSNNGNLTRDMLYQQIEGPEGQSDIGWVDAFLLFFSQTVLLSSLFLGTDNSKLIINWSSDRGEEVLEGEMQLHSEADSRANTKLTAHLWRPSKAETELHSGNHQEAHRLSQNGPPGEENSKWTHASGWQNRPSWQQSTRVPSRRVSNN